MARRTKDQRDQDRADLVHALEEAGRPMHAEELVAAANGVKYTAEGSEMRRHGWVDIRALERANTIVWVQGGYTVATPELLDELEDLADVSRQSWKWEPVE